jgi:hypothetical protein
MFSQGFGGWFVLILLIIPILKWAFPKSEASREESRERKKIKQELRRLKRK